MRWSPSTRPQLRLVNLIFVLLFFAAIGLLQWISQHYDLRFDWTQNSANTLSPASIAVAKRLKEPLKITAFAGPLGETRRDIQDMVTRYQKYKPDIQIEFVNPDTAPERVRTAGVQFDGELVLEYGDAKENIPPAQFNEENFTNALTRLGHRGERWVVFLSGHGERSPDRQANFDLSTWASQLHKRGFKTRTLSLGDHPQIPSNTTVLVIAGPRTRLLPGEVKEIQNHLDRGGNLLWMHDPGSLFGLEPLAESLGIEFLPGVIVDPASEDITGNAAAIVIAKYGAHPVVRNFADNTVFPQAGGLSLRAPEGWQGSVLMDTRTSSWSETGALNGPIRFDKGKDIRGPLNLAVALSRLLEKREQRVIVFGDGDFLSNTYLPNGGNLELGMSLVNWLSQDDAFVNIPVKTVRDRSLDLSPVARNTIAVAFLVLLPLVLVSSGAWIWLRRRKR
jgi:ABC-type uncharacterized transport system involved in gliding motility auxiliary subunit